ncbi:MAG: HlyD family secretion protein [Rhodospirillales bacterium]|jgi:membrane fusion protein (multidrug efflux system)|nr:HlyD family secretion protein [Rhodospirillales bacterium]HJN22628.1 HlyD family secretion protein [Rhodospirillales bacterium]
MTDTDDIALLELRRRKGRRFLAMLVMFVLAPSIFAAAGVYYYAIGGRYVSTENAFVKSEKIAISADVSGRVTDVAVNDNDRIAAGRPLFWIDEEPFRIVLARGDAQLAMVRQDIGELRALHRQKKAELRLEEKNLDYYRREHERQQKLRQKGFVSQSKLDDVERSMLTARERLAAIRHEIAGIIQQLGGITDGPMDKHPRLREARAVRDQAALDLRRTAVKAPASGVVTNFHLQAGEYVEAGTPVFTIIGDSDIWIEANFKETDLTNIQVGQNASLRFDTYPDLVREAVVASISPATGAEFALLPPQNATGNWVKVVQRLPVRLEMKAVAGGPSLRAGISVIVEIDIRKERPLPTFLSEILSWFKEML